MAKFTVYTADNTPKAVKASLAAANASFGFIPNLQATMADPPSCWPGIRRSGTSLRRRR